MFYTVCFTPNLKRDVHNIDYRTLSVHVNVVNDFDLTISLSVDSKRYCHKYDFIGTFVLSRTERNTSKIEFSKM